MVSSLGIEKSEDIGRLRSRPRVHGVDPRREQAALRTHDHYQAERQGDEAWAERAAKSIRTQYALIRGHCAAADLSLPPDVPETDE
jgi:hypothetical protein